MLRVGLMFCLFCFCCGWLGPCGARPQPQNAAIYSVWLRLRFRAGLRAVLFRLVVLGPLARPRATSVGALLDLRKLASQHHLGCVDGWSEQNA